MKYLKLFLRVLDAIPRFFGYALFYAALGAALFWLCRAGAPDYTPKPGGVLYLPLSGTIADTAPEVKLPMGLSGADFLAEVGEKPHRLSELTEAIRLAETDSNIAGIFLNLEGLRSAGLASVRELGDALDHYRSASGRPVLAWAENYSQLQYALAAHASLAAVHPMGRIELKGFSGTSLYWGKTLEMLGISADVYRAGAFKSAPEIFERDAPSEENLLAQAGWMDPAWNDFVRRIESARDLPEGSVEGWFRSAADPESALCVNPAEELRRRGFIHAVHFGEEDFWEDTAFKAGLSEKKKVDYRDYLPVVSDPSDDSPVAVLFLEGVISDSDSTGIVARDVVEALDGILKDAPTRALVLRINSPGGEAFASERIRWKLSELRRTRGLHVVVSMGDTAASGGYWVSLAAEKIVADPMTITGSIGVFSVVPHFDRMLEKLDARAGGRKTAPLADINRISVRPGPAVRALHQSDVDRIYRRFKALVSESRKIPEEKLEALAQGRVWLGEQARELGLVDSLGTLDDALKEAWRLAGGNPAETPRARLYEGGSKGAESVLPALLGKLPAWTAEGMTVPQPLLSEAGIPWALLTFEARP